MAVRIAIVVAFVALAGCSSPAADDAAATSQSSSLTNNIGQAPVVPPPEPVVTPIDWNGKLVTGVWACDGTATHQCTAQPAGSFGTDKVYDGFAGNLTAGQLALEWTAATPLTDELVLEVHVMPACDGCEVTSASRAGRSPISLELPAGLPLAPEDQLVVVVYSNRYTAQPGLAAGTSGDQDFHVTGEITTLA